MKVSPEARRLAKYKEKKKEISVVTLQFDVTFCTSILCAPSLRYFDDVIMTTRRETQMGDQVIFISYPLKFDLV